MSVNLKRPQPRDQTNIQCYLQNSEYCRHNLAKGPTAKADNRLVQNEIAGQP